MYAQSCERFHDLVFLIYSELSHLLLLPVGVWVHAS